MALNTNTYGYVIDPFFSFCDQGGKTIANGYVRIFLAGTSTPVLTYRNFDGAFNAETIELDNSGRALTNVIASKGSLYKVCVYDAEHSQEDPILTVDKVAVIGASVNATNVVTGLDNVTVQEENFLKATVSGTDVELALDPTEVTSDVSTISDAATAAPDYVVPLLDKTGTGDGKKISLANLFKFALGWISRLETTITAFRTGDVIPVDGPSGTAKMSKDSLLKETALLQKKYTVKIGSNVYRVVRIGKYLFTDTNLRETFGTLDTDYKYALNSKGYSEDYGAGLLYKASSVEDANGMKSDFSALFPTGWGIPSNSDFSDFRTYIGGNTSGNKLFAESSMWTNHLRNEYGFGAVKTGIITSTNILNYDTSSVYLVLGLYSGDARVARLDDSLSTNFAFYSLNIGNFYAIRPCCVMASAYSNPADYGCVEYKEEVPAPPESGSRTLVSNDGVFSWTETQTQDQKTEYVVKINGNYYDVVKIGKYLFTKRNLSEKFGTYATDWLYAYNSQSYSERFAAGLLYKLSSVLDSDGMKSAFASMFPTGWGVPSNTDIQNFRTYIGGSSSGDKLFAESSMWSYSDNNALGFTAVKTGYYRSAGVLAYDYAATMITSPLGSNVAFLEDAASSNFIFRSGNSDYFYAIRPCCVMSSDLDNPEDYGCEVKEVHLNFPSKTGAYEFSFNEGVGSWKEKSVAFFTGDTRKLSVVAAKEVCFDDGTTPKIEFYLVEDAATHKFYFSSDLKNFVYAFSIDIANFNTNSYSFAIRPNNDVIAVFRAESIPSSASQDDDNRNNPLVLLASEQWRVVHEVDFGDSLKPCGWISNKGYTNLPDGSSIMCEYTRPTVETANLWKIAANADLLDKNSYVVKYSFNVDPDELLFKHFHGVQHDQFTGIDYFYTGDSNEGAFVYYSTDRGDTWTLAHEGSQRYCRLLNFIFTKDYVYWGADFPDQVRGRPIFRCERNADGVIDYSTITEWTISGQGEGHGAVACYGLVYLEDLKILVVADHNDTNYEVTEMSFPLYYLDLTDNELHVAGTIYGFSDDLESKIGFRTRFTQIYDRCVFGFGGGNRQNWNKGFDNSISDRVESIILDFFRLPDGSCSFKMDIVG